MAISYKKLWKLLIDNDMKKKDLPAFANISLSTVTKMSHDENVSTEILGRICAAFNCNIEDIVEFTEKSDHIVKKSK